MPSIFGFIVYFFIISYIAYIITCLFYADCIACDHSDKQIDAMNTFLRHLLETASWFILSISLYIMFSVPFIALVAYALVESLHSGFTHFNIGGLTKSGHPHAINYIIQTFTNNRS
jgi:hypothetical protein